MPNQTSLRRLQHSGFGAEIRKLINSKNVADHEVAGIIVDEIEALARAKARNEVHPFEDRMEADLSEVGYLRLYKGGHSIRVYFVVIDGTLWMLMALTKRVTKLGKGTVSTLKQRLSETKSLAKEAENVRRRIRRTAPGGSC